MVGDTLCAGTQPFRLSSYTVPATNPLKSYDGTAATAFNADHADNPPTNGWSAHCVDWLACATIGSVIPEARTPFDRDGGEPEAGWFPAAESGGPVAVTEAAFSPDDPKRLKLEVDREFAVGETVTDNVDAEGGRHLRARRDGARGRNVRRGGGRDRDAAHRDGPGPRRRRRGLGGLRGRSGTAALTLAHTVAAADVSTGGVTVVADSLELDGGTIRSSASGQEADLSHAVLAADPAHNADGRIEPSSGRREPVRRPGPRERRCRRDLSRTPSRPGVAGGSGAGREPEARPWAHPRIGPRDLRELCRQPHIDGLVESLDELIEPLERSVTPGLEGAGREIAALRRREVAPERLGETGGPDSADERTKRVARTCWTIDRRLRKSANLWSGSTSPSTFRRSLEQV